MDESLFYELQLYKLFDPDRFYRNRNTIEFRGTINTSLEARFFEEVSPNLPAEGSLGNVCSNVRRTESKRVSGISAKNVKFYDDMRTLLSLVSYARYRDSMDKLNSLMSYFVVAPN